LDQVLDPRSTPRPSRLAAIIRYNLNTVDEQEQEQESCL